MRTPKLQRNEVWGRPENSAIYTATVPRLSGSIEQVLKAFVPKQENIDALYHALVRLLEPASIRVAFDAYAIGASDVLMPVDKVQAIALKNIASASAVLASHQVTNTTAKACGLSYSFNAGMSKDNIATKYRAKSIGKHQMDLNFFRGLRYGWRLNQISRKRSFVSDEHDIDDICDDNEEAGAIGIDEVFPSGDFETPFHFNCVCTMILVR